MLLLGIAFAWQPSFFLPILNVNTSNRFVSSRWRAHSDQHSYQQNDKHQHQLKQRKRGKSISPVFSILLLHHTPGLSRRHTRSHGRNSSSGASASCRYISLLFRIRKVQDRESIQGLLQILSDGYWQLCWRFGLIPCTDSYEIELKQNQVYQTITISHLIPWKLSQHIPSDSNLLLIRQSNLHRQARTVPMLAPRRKDPEWWSPKSPRTAICYARLI